MLHVSLLMPMSELNVKLTCDICSEEMKEMHRKIGKEQKASAFEADPTKKIQHLTARLAQVLLLPFPIDFYLH